MNKILIICGPTATGKTDLARMLAGEWNGELVSADSRQVYQGFDALTGKVRSNDIPIWLYDDISAREIFSAGDFVIRAQPVIDDITKRGKLPIIAGGTGFYLRALMGSVDTIFIPPDAALRKKLNLQSLEKLQKSLQQADAGRWAQMNESDRLNSRRLIRAIEVAHSPRSPQKILLYNALWIGLTAPLPVLKKRITQSVQGRFETALGEIRSHELLPDILGVDPLQAYLRGEKTKEDTLAQWIQAEYQYAKRQMTWFRKEQGIHWYDVSDKRYLKPVAARVTAWYTH